MSRKYNEEFIKEFRETDYIRCLRTINYLDKLRNNYNYRYDPSYNYFDGTVNLFKESLDHYVLRRMENDGNFISTVECDNYFSYLRKLSNSNNYDFYTNVVLYNILNNSKFSKYKQKYIGIQEKQFRDKISKNVLKINDINNKIIKNQRITQDELDMICGYVSDYRENSSTLKMVIQYIFNNLTKQDCNLKCSPQVISAILTYVPYTCSEINKNGFDPANVRIFAANNYYNGKKYNGMGQSSGNLRQIIFNGRVVKDTNFKSIVSSENPFSFKEYFKYKDYSFTLMLMTAYHEITHQYQRYMSKINMDKFFVNSDFFRDGLPMALRNILDDELHDYHHNHDNDDIEIQATQIGWKLCNRFYGSVLSNGPLKKELCSRSTKNMHGTQTRYSFIVKKDNNGRLFDSVEYTLMKSLIIMRDSKKREKYFNEMPYLQHIFTDDGRFNINILFISDFGYTHLGAGLLENLINSKGIDDKISNKIKGKRKDTLDVVAANIYKGIDFWYRRMYLLDYYTVHDFNDDFEVNLSFLEVANNILDKQVDTIKNGKRILHQVLNCHAYDDLITSGRRKTVEYYKEIVENIKNSKHLKNKGKSGKR